METAIEEFVLASAGGDAKEAEWLRLDAGFWRSVLSDIKLGLAVAEWRRANHGLS